MSGTLGNRAYFQNVEILKSNLGGSSSNADISSYYGNYLYIAEDPIGRLFYNKLNLNENGIGITTSLDSNFNNIIAMNNEEHPYSILTPNYLVRPVVMNYDEPAFLVPSIDGLPSVGKYINSVAEIYLQPNGNISIQFRYSGLDQSETNNEVLVKVVESKGWSILNGVVYSPLWNSVRL